MDKKTAESLAENIKRQSDRVRVQSVTQSVGPGWEVTVVVDEAYSQTFRTMGAWLDFKRDVIGVVGRGPGSETIYSSHEGDYKDNPGKRPDPAQRHYPPRPGAE